MFSIAFQYIHSLPPQDAANLAFLLMNTAFFAMIGLAGYFAYDMYESRKIDKELAEEEKNTKEANEVENIEHVVYEHGSKELMIEIHHYADPLRAKFLRIIRNITTNMSLHELLQSLHEVLECMDSHNHINYDDTELVFHILSHQEGFSHETIQHAKHWLHIAKTYWLMYPSNPMVSFSVPLEELEGVENAERQVNRSKSF